MRKAEILEGVEDVLNAHFVAEDTLLINHSDGSSTIRLRRTDVLRIHKQGFTVALDPHSRGLSANRINRYLPGNIRIQRSMGSWVVNIGGVAHRFRNGSIICKGKVWNPTPPTKKVEEPRRAVEVNSPWVYAATNTYSYRPTFANSMADWTAYLRAADAGIENILNAWTDDSPEREGGQ